MFVVEDLAGWRPVYSLPVTITEEQFWEGVGVWTKKPYLVNKSIGGVQQFDMGKHVGCGYLNELSEHLGKMKCADEYLEFKQRLLSSLDEVECSSHKSLCSEGHPTSHLYLNLFCPRLNRPRRDLLSLVLFDESNKMAVFVKPVVEEVKPKLGPDVPYGIKFNEGSLTLNIQDEVRISEDDLNWICSVLFPALVKWSSATLKSTIQSLSLIPVDEYCLVYNCLKEKYGKLLCNIWTEVTDPQKFIYEDIAIASYLILLWKRKPMRFVDLGCGNGLLVHILNSENHLGIGLDVRARKIWEKYPSSTVLKVGTVTPSDSSLFPDTDWIIGNHSDELSPWIPVIAARSSYACNFFLLPCCTYEFNGQKYERTNSSLSQYADYVEYLKRVSEVCGFHVRTDRLRIPSTKRICLVGEGRKYPEGETAAHDKAIIDYIENRSSSEITDKGTEQISDKKKNENWIKNFTPRESKERVRNCTHLNTTLVKDIIEDVAACLLRLRNQSGRNSDWDEGTRTHLEDIVDAIPRQKILHLKAECGGLKTLLRNNRHIFKVENDMVLFRRPSDAGVDLKGTKNWKKKPCWFFSNHPDSCPLESDSCSFMH